MLSGYEIRKVFDDGAKALRSRLRETPQEGWIRRTREALRMSQGELAYLAGVEQSTIHRLEENEVNKKIQLDTLEKLADAMGCDLYYGFMPRTSLQEAYVNQAHKHAEVNEARLHNNMELEDQQVKHSEHLVKVFATQLMQRDAVKWKI